MFAWLWEGLAGTLAWWPIDGFRLPTEKPRKLFRFGILRCPFGSVSALGVPVWSAFWVCWRMRLFDPRANKKGPPEGQSLHIEISTIVLWSQGHVSHGRWGLCALSKDGEAPPQIPRRGTSVGMTEPERCSLCRPEGLEGSWAAGQCSFRLSGERRTRSVDHTGELDSGFRRNDGVEPVMLGAALSEIPRRKTSVGMTEWP